MGNKIKRLFIFICFFRGHEPKGPIGFEEPLDNHRCRICSANLWEEY